MGTIQQMYVRNYHKENPERKIQVYLPGRYGEERTEHFPVLYMHDGQNLFFEEDSFSGVTWGVQKTLQAAEKAGHPGMIVVGIENAGDRRMEEYAPFPYKVQGQTERKPGGEAYAEWIVRELKPAIDAKYRTRRERNSTFIAGSSAGANISLYVGIAYASLFSGVGCFSPALWIFCESDWEAFLQKNGAKKDAAFFIQCGTEEGGTDRVVSQKYIDTSQWLDRTLQRHGAGPNQIERVIAPGLGHSERAWQAMFPQFVQFLQKKFAGV